MKKDPSPTLRLLGLLHPPRLLQIRIFLDHLITSPPPRLYIMLFTCTLQPVHIVAPGCAHTCGRMCTYMRQAVYMHVLGCAFIQCCVESCVHNVVHR